jgi:hypothetical protein
MLRALPAVLRRPHRGRKRWVGGVVEGASGGSSEVGSSAADRARKTICHRSQGFLVTDDNDMQLQ